DATFAASPLALGNVPHPRRNSGSHSQRHQHPYGPRFCGIFSFERRTRNQEPRHDAGDLLYCEHWAHGRSVTTRSATLDHPGERTHRLTNVSRTRPTIHLEKRMKVRMRITKLTLSR